MIVKFAAVDRSQWRSQGRDLAKRRSKLTPVRLHGAIIYRLIMYKPGSGRSRDFFYVDQCSDAQSTSAWQQICSTNQEEPFGGIGGELLRFGGESAQCKENVGWLVSPASLGQAGNLRLEGAQITQPHYAIRAPLAFTKKVDSVSEFRHEIDFRTTIPAPVARHLANG